MASNEPAGDTVSLRLQEAIDRLQEDVRRVEIWAGALSGFLKPVPDYEGEQHQALLPRRERRLPRNGKTGSKTAAPGSFSTPFKDA